MAQAVQEDMRAAVMAALEEARERTWLLVEGLPDDELATAACGYLSPPAWDLGHIANFEELWLVQNLLGRPEMHAGHNDTYNAFEHPRPERPSLPLLDRRGLRAYMAEVRTQSLAALQDADMASSPLLKGAFVHWMIVLHEHQHQETVLQTLQMLGPGRYTPPPARALPQPATTAAKAPGWPADATAGDDRLRSPWLDVPAGAFEMGTSLRPGVYDNESRPHTVHVDAFQIARFPVTCGEYLQFIESGGYEEARWWSGRGRKWLDETPHHAPMYWHFDTAWRRRTLTGTAAVLGVADEILCHVSWFEAEAYAAWAGGRLPTEEEWERVCRGQGRNPWGDAPATTEVANIDQLGLGPGRAGAYPAGASPCGALHMIGDVWEWTSSDFQPYPGFEAFPYDEYSQVFFGGDYKVLRGGSWATRAGCATGTFRNWDHPYRRQIFSGIRLARDPA